jgi:uncharacterized protein (DUF2336 family)
MDGAAKQRQTSVKALFAQILFGCGHFIYSFTVRCGAPTDARSQDREQRRMNARQALIKELQTAIEAGPKDKRVKTLRALTQVFVDVAHRLPDELVDLFGDVICYLIEQVETAPLAELSERLAVVDNAPKEVVDRLARNSDASVARPVLAQSERLTSDELANLAMIKEEAHLLAIAARKRLEVKVTDALLNRRNTQVARALAGNSGAVFSDVGFNLLIESGAEDAPTAEKLVQRSDVTPAHVNALVARADEDVRKLILAAAPAQRRATVEAALEKNSKSAARSDSASKAYSHTTNMLMEQLEGRPTEADVLGFATLKKPVEVICCLAMICRVPPETIEALLDEQRREPFMMVCKAANFKWPTVRALVEMREAPGPKLQDALTQACEDFNRISPVVAQQALRMWQKKVSG